MSIGIVQVDAFTSEAFAGNPAAVCVLSAPRDERWMQLVAREMAILGDRIPASDRRRLRASMVHAGHRSGPVRTCYARERARAARDQAAGGGSHRALPHEERYPTATSSDGWIELDFPARQTRRLLRRPVWQLRWAHSRAMSAGPVSITCWRLEDEATIRKLEPDFARLRGYDARGVIATARATTPGVDFVSRYFAPAFGIDEDPVTGSTHCCLGPFWSRRLKKSSFVARQVSARGGEMRVTLDRDRVNSAGQAVTVLRGELTAVAESPACRDSPTGRRLPRPPIRTKSKNTSSRVSRTASRSLLTRRRFSCPHQSAASLISAAASAGISRI